MAINDDGKSWAATGTATAGWTASGIDGDGGLGGGRYGDGRFGEDGWAAVGSARRRGAGRRQVLATEGWTAADAATAGWAAASTVTAGSAAEGTAKVSFCPRKREAETRSGNHRSSAHALVRPLRPARARCKDAPLTLLASRHDAGRYGLRGRQPGEQTARLVVGTGVTKVTRRLQSGAASSRAALRGFRAALPAALRCRPGSPARIQGCRQGSPALAAWQPCAPRLAALLAFPGSPALASRQPCAAAALPPGSPARQPCAAALRGSPARQPCAAPAALRGSPGCGLFREVRGGASAPPLHPSHAQNGDCPQGKADLRGRRAALHCRPRRAPGAGSPLRGPSRRSPALAAQQPCAGSKAALRGSKAAGQAALRRRTFGSLGRFQGCLAGSPPCCRAPLSLKQSCAAQISRSPGAFCAGFFYKRRDRHSPEPPERPAGAPGRPGARGRSSAPHL